MKLEDDDEVMMLLKDELIINDRPDKVINDDNLKIQIFNHKKLSMDS